MAIDDTTMLASDLADSANRMVEVRVEYWPSIDAPSPVVLNATVLAASPLSSLRDIAVAALVGSAEAATLPDGADRVDFALFGRSGAEIALEGTAATLINTDSPTGDIAAAFDGLFRVFLVAKVHGTLAEEVGGGTGTTYSVPRGWPGHFEVVVVQDVPDSPTTPSDASAPIVKAGAKSSAKRSDTPEETAQAAPTSSDVPGQEEEAPTPTAS